MSWDEWVEAIQKLDSSERRELLAFLWTLEEEADEAHGSGQES